MSDEPNFTRSCYATDADLYKAKAAYYEAKFDSLTAELNNHDYKLGKTVKALQAKVEELETTVKDLVGVAQYSSYGRHYLRAYYPSLKTGDK